MNFLILLSILSFGLSLAIVGLIKNYLAQKLLDIPNKRSSHTQPTPRGGGLGLIIAFFLTSSLANRSDLLQYWTQWAILLPLILVGFLDDYRGVSAKIRYLVQFGTAILAIAYYGYVHFPLDSTGLLGIGITLIAITALINFYNFMDGLDGLVASVTVVQLGFFAIYLQQPQLWLLVGALCGFLWWNWSPAKIFMGDVGSTFLGAIIAITLLQNASQPMSMWQGFAVTLPLIGDAIYTLTRRLCQAENIFEAHRTHIYQRLQKTGWSHAAVAGTYAVITLVVAVILTQNSYWSLGLSLLVTLLGLILGEWYLQAKKAESSQIELN